MFLVELLCCTVNLRVKSHNSLAGSQMTSNQLTRTGYSQCDVTIINRQPTLSSLRSGHTKPLIPMDIDN